MFIGDNATGKTSILCAIRTLLYELFPYISTNKYGKNIAKGSFYGVDRAIKWSDVYAIIDSNNLYKNLWPCKINASSNEYMWSVIRRNRKGGCKLTGAKPAIKYLDSLLDAIHESRNADAQFHRPILPLIAYYGTERSEFYNGRRFDRQHHPWDGYKACLNQKISISSFKEWFVELQRLSKYEDTAQTYLPLLQLFKRKLCSCFTEERIVDLYYEDKIYNTDSEKNELIDDIVIVKVNEEGNKERVLMSSLSAGYRIMLAFISDLIMRCITLNEHLGDQVVAETPGLVLIDEIDMHLHPLWQRHIVADLMRCFPKIQFITTTHSPFIVQSLHADQIINLQKNQLDDVYITKDPSTLNVNESSRLMGVVSPYGSKEAERRSIEVQLYNLLQQEQPDKDELRTLVKAYKENNNVDPYFEAHLSYEEKQKFNNLEYRAKIMRPLSIPNQPEGFEYSPANGRNALSQQIGYHCSYCETHLDERNIEIEHIIPQNGGASPHTDKWYNFLLSCGGCNKAKNRRAYDITRCNLSTFVLPHIDDTFHLIDYNQTTRIPCPKNNLSKREKGRVEKTLKMLKYVASNDINEWTDIATFDEFAVNRIDAFEIAERKRKKYEKAKIEHNDEECRDIVTDLIKFAQKDNWSAYVYVFNDILEVREQLLQCIKGTDLKYFEDLSPHERDEYNKYKYYRYYLQITITELETTQLSESDKQRELKEARAVKAEIEQMSTISKEQKIELLTHIQTILEILK